MYKYNKLTKQNKITFYINIRYINLNERKKKIIRAHSLELEFKTKKKKKTKKSLIYIVFYTFYLCQCILRCVRFNVIMFFK